MRVSFREPTSGCVEASDNEKDDAATPANVSQSVFQLLGAVSKADEQSKLDYSDHDSDEDQDVGEIQDVAEEEAAAAEVTETLGSSKHRGLNDSGMDQMLQLEAQRSETVVSPYSSHADEREDISEESTTLAAKLKTVFAFSEEEEFIAEYQCWLLKSILLLGYMYVTSNHISFYAYLPRKDDTTLKSGYFAKKSRTTRRYRRYWFVLKNDVLSYFHDAVNLYFPSGNIDLRYAVSATYKKQSPKHFVLATRDQKHSFVADSEVSAQEWVKALKNVIFRTHNVGDSVKISVPVENVFDVEQSPALDFADTVQLKVVDDDGTYAIDEYFFSFLSKGKEAFKTIVDVTENHAPQRKLHYALNWMEADTVQETPPPPRIDSKTLATKTRPIQAVTSNQKLSEQTTKAKADDSGSAEGVIGRSSAGSDRNEPLTSGSLKAEAADLGTEAMDRWEGGSNDSWATWVKSRTSRVSSLVGRPADYLDKMSAIITSRHIYAQGQCEAQTSTPIAEERFRQHFALPVSETLVAVFYGYLHRTLPVRGKIYVGNNYFCYRSLVPAMGSKLILPHKDIENVEKEKGFRFGWSGLVVVVRGHEGLFFEFGNRDERDECAITLLKVLDIRNQIGRDTGRTAQEEELSARASEEHRLLEEARARQSQHNESLPVEKAGDVLPILFDSSQYSLVQSKPSKNLRFTCLTIGSRGDVQPYIALCRGLKADGHSVKIATHGEFKEWIEKYGIEFADVEGEPAELMRICTEYGMFTFSFLKEASSKLRGWIDTLLVSSWDACQGTDVLIESPSAMAGIHIAEALGVPYYRAFTMPWTRTRAYPHAFFVPEHKMGGSYNYYSYVMFDNLFWKATSSQINKWRKKCLQLPPTGLEQMQQHRVPFLYNFSPVVVPPPLDFADWVQITGYWTLDEGGPEFKPPVELTNFIEKARMERKKLVYIGFGSIVVADAKALTRSVIESVLKADVFCILSKGWSDRGRKTETPLATQDEIQHAREQGEVYAEPVQIPTQVYQIDAVPHDWLFRQVDAAVHHGGAGTTGASLRAGIPTVIKPFFGDQFFFAARVEDLGVGIYLKKVNVSHFSKALWEATNSERLIKKAASIGEQIRAENGVQRAITVIYRDLEYARSLVKRKTDNQMDSRDDSEESWAMLDDDKYEGGSDISNPHDDVMD